MADIQDLIVKASPQAPSKFIIIGDPFSGKTTLASKAPKPLFLSTDGNAAKAGLDAVFADSLNTVRRVIEYFPESKEYDTLVIDTIEGISDLFERSEIERHNEENPEAMIKALTDVPYGKLTGSLNKRLASFSEKLLMIPKNVIILSYMKRQVDDVSSSIVLSSELKGIRHFTKFADGMILTTYDGDKHEARVLNKRATMAGDVDYGDIENFLGLAGWALPTRKSKVGTTKKK